MKREELTLDQYRAQVTAQLAEKANARRAAAAPDPAAKPAGRGTYAWATAQNIWLATNGQTVYAWRWTPAGRQETRRYPAGDDRRLDLYYRLALDAAARDDWSTP